MAVDDFYPDPDIVRRKALEMPYTHPEEYVGWRTRAFHTDGIKERIEQSLRLRLTSWEGNVDEINLGNGVFFTGFASGPKAETVGIHYDTPADFVTMVVYLTPNAPFDTGTSLWQHRATGLTAKPTPADAGRLKMTLEELEELLLRDGQQPRKWLEIDRVGNVYNRAVFYYSGMLHSATRHFGSNLRNGRIYQTFRFGVDWNGTLT